MAIHPSTDILNRIKKKFPDTWYLEVLPAYMTIQKNNPLSDDAVQLYACIQNALKMQADWEKLRSVWTGEQ
jgi:hypothetical protein